MRSSYLSSRAVGVRLFDKVYPENSVVGHMPLFPVLRAQHAVLYQAPYYVHCLCTWRERRRSVKLKERVDIERRQTDSHMQKLRQTLQSWWGRV